MSRFLPVSTGPAECVAEYMRFGAHTPVWMEPVRFPGGEADTWSVYSADIEVRYFGRRNAAVRAASALADEMDDSSDRQSEDE